MPKHSHKHQKDPGDVADSLDHVHANQGRHAAATADADFPTQAKGKHANEKDLFSPDSERYASKLREARRRRTSIIASASIAVVGTLVGVALAAVANHIDVTEATLDHAAEGTAALGEQAGGSASEDDMALSLDSGSAAATGFPADDASARLQDAAGTGAPSDSVEAALDRFGAHQVTAADLSGLSGQQEPFAFALGTEDASQPRLSSESADKLKAAIDAASEGDAQVSLLLVDLETGRGIAANLDAQPYGASSFKGPFCAYLCERADAGDVDIAGAADRIEATIVYSDNDAYDSLRMQFESDGLRAWLDACGAGGDEQLYRDWYPFQSARQSGAMWLHVNSYLDSGSDNAKWLSGLMGDTSTSFIRNAIGSDGVTVRNKGGWYAATWDDASTWNGTCDAGLASCNGHTYLISIMTGQPMTDSAIANVETLARTLWTARADLA